jgi:hypothetical protein
MSTRGRIWVGLVVLVLAAAALLVRGSPVRRILGIDVSAWNGGLPAPELPPPGEGDLVAAEGRLAVETAVRLVEAAGGLAVVAEGDEVRALDPIGGGQVWGWRQDGTEAVALQADGDQVLVAFAAPGLDREQVRVRTFDAATGELRSTRVQPRNTPLVGQATASVETLHDDELVMVAEWEGVLLAEDPDGIGPLVALDSETGEERWRLPDDERGATAGIDIAGDLLYVLGIDGANSDVTAVDLRTGERLARLDLVGVPSVTAGPPLRADDRGLVLVDNLGDWLPVTWEPAG